MTDTKTEKRSLNVEISWKGNYIMTKDELKRLLLQNMRYMENVEVKKI